MSEASGPALRVPVFTELGLILSTNSMPVRFYSNANQRDPKSHKRPCCGVKLVRMRCTFDVRPCAGDSDVAIFTPAPRIFPAVLVMNRLGSRQDLRNAGRAVASSKNNQRPPPLWEILT